MAALIGGTWKCSGTAVAPDHKPVKLEGTLKSALDLDGRWLHDSLTATVGAAARLRFEAYMTYDAATKKWRRIAVDSAGHHAVGTSDGPKDGKLEWSGETVTPDGATANERTHIDMSDLKKGAHITGEVSRDQGKTWAQTTDVVCKR